MNESILPKVSVIVPVYNGESVIERCLNHLLHQKYPVEKLEIIVVDNGSTDKTVQIIESMGLKSFYAARKGPAAARNEGMKIASGEIVVFVDADCLAEPDLIIHHVLTHLYCQVADPQVAMIGGSVKGYNTNYWSTCDDFCSWWEVHPSQSRRYVAYHPGVNLSMRGELIKKGYFFDEELQSSEDIILCLSVTRDGYKILFNPSAVVSHINRADFRSFMKHNLNWTRSFYLELQKGIRISPEHFRYPKYKSLIYHEGLPWWKWLGWKFYPLLRCLIFNGCGFIISIYGIIRLAVRARRFQVIWCLPFIIISKIHIFFLITKISLKFCSDQRKLSKPQKETGITLSGK
jgi:glycosyltransferase involved in cell wall biosynthesis